MNMTHYMSLLSDNQPWNLIIFMAIPVICDYRFDEDDNFIYLVCKATGNAVYKAPK